ncbi:MULTISPECIES: cytochrome P450 [unclassified Streptomyces]|uniref:cytochrome P450 n=1 Tax=unclassified Streptomyces TaxID=2593676 RepID=UPI003814EFF3
MSVSAAPLTPQRPAAWCPEHLLDPYTAVDPHPFYAWLRATGPVQWNEPAQAWYVTSYDLVARLLLDARLGARSKQAQLARLDPVADAEVFAIEEFLAQWLVFSDPPFQARLRKLVAPRFTPRALGALDGVVAEAARRHAGALGPGRHDLLAEVIRPFALDVVCRVLGIRDADRDAVLGWSDALVHYLSRPGIETAAARAAADAAALLTDYVAGRALADADGPVAQALAGPHVRGELSGTEAAAVYAQILTGGIEPVAAATAAGLSHLFGDREQRRAVHTGAVARARAVEEILRFGSPFHYAPRTALDDLTVAGRRIERGQRVVLVLVAANRDPAVFADPDRFDIHRPAPERHLSFGRGGHYCLGSVLARRQIAAITKELDHVLPVDGPGPLVQQPSLGMTTVVELPCLI